MNFMDENYEPTSTLQRDNANNEPVRSSRRPALRQLNASEAESRGVVKTRSSGSLMSSQEKAGAMDLWRPRGSNELGRGGLVEL